MTVLPRPATSPELALMRSDNQSSHVFMTIYSPPVVYSARLAAVPASTDSVASIAYNSFIRRSVSAWFLPMRMIVLGAGLIGTTTAYYLSKFGHEVVVIARQSTAGLETSFANAGAASVSELRKASQRVLLPTASGTDMLRD